MDAATEPGWLCDCGHWSEHDFHCDACAREPPWGCDCGCRDELADDCGEIDYDPFDLGGEGG